MTTLAFPGAEGFAAYTQGGRNFTSADCYLVNTTDDNDDAPVLQDNRTYTSSFRAACHASGPRFIVPITGGTCNLSLSDNVGVTGAPSIAVDNNDVTIIGGLAPGGGFAINGIFYCRCSQFICTHMRFRMDDNSGPAGNGRNSFSSVGGNQIILDHCTVAWCHDNSPGAGEITNLTYSNCLIGPPLNVGGQGRGPLLYGDNISFLRNLMYNVVDRAPQIQGAPTGCEVMYNSILDRVIVVRTRILPYYGIVKANVQGNSHFWFSGTDLTIPSSFPPNSGWDYTKPISWPQGQPFSVGSELYVEDNYDEWWRSAGTEDEDLNLWINGTLTGTLRGTALDFTGNTNYVQPTVTTAADAHTANINATTGVGAWRVRDADANFAVARDTADTILITNSSYGVGRPSVNRSLFHPLAKPTVDSTSDHVSPFPVLASGTPLGSAYNGHLTNGGIPDSYTLPTGEKWFDLRTDGYNYLEGYAYGLTRYWDSEPVNVPTNIFINAFPVTPGTYTVLTGLSVFDGDSDIATVTFTSVGNTASLQLSDDSGVDLDI